MTTIKDLPPYDPTKPSVPIKLEGDGYGQVNRPKQMINLLLSFDRLVDLLRIPDDHTMKRVTLAKDEYEPALLIMLEGPGGRVYKNSYPVYIEDFDTFIKEVAHRREQAAEFFLRQEKERGFGT